MNALKHQNSLSLALSLRPLRFSVIVPYYKADATILRTLRSILAQTHPCHEVLLIDDDSQDSIAETVLEFAPLFAKFNAPLVLIHNPRNGGPSVARNLGWARASGDYIAFLDSDDEWHPNKLQVCADMLAQDRAVGVFHESCVEWEEGGRFECGARRLGDFKWRNIPRYKWLIKNRAATPSVVVSNQITDRFDPTLRFCEDHELWLRIAFHHGPFVQLVGPPLTRLGRPTMAPGGQSSRIHRMRAGEMHMYAKFCGSRPLYLLLLLPLWWWSLMKYIYFLLRRNWAVLRKK